MFNPEQIKKQQELQKRKDQPIRHILRRTAQGTIGGLVVSIYGAVGGDTFLGLHVRPSEIIAPAIILTSMGIAIGLGVGACQARRS